jgi:tRNA-dihydrouridine synthase
MSIYDDIKKEKGYVTALAPMEGVTDSVFRQMVSKLGKPDLFFTEFLNVEGFCSKGRDKVVHRLDFEDLERPVVVQLWGNVPEYYAKTIEYVKELKPVGIDINMGCSVRDVLSSGRGSGLIKDKVLAREIISAVKESAGDLPVSVKTRLGYDELEIEGWIGYLLKQNLDMLTIHGRLAKEGYSTPSRWDILKDCVNLRNEISPNTLILGNGDIKSFEQGTECVKKYSLDGFMVGRYILNDPWLFSQRKDISKEERILALKDHMNLYVNKFKDSKSYNSQKKYIKAYINNFDGAGELRQELLEVSDLESFFQILDSHSL